MTHDVPLHIHAPDPPSSAPRSPHIRTPALDKWPEEHSDLLTEPVTENKISFRNMVSAINEKFSTSYTRSAMIGRARRLGLCKAVTRRCPDEYKERTRKRYDKHNKQRRIERTHRPKLRIVMNGGGLRLLHSVQSNQPDLRAVDVEPLNLTFDQLQNGDCKWPYGDGPFLFCGHPAIEGRPYCRGHCAIAYRPMEERRAGR